MHKEAVLQQFGLTEAEVKVYLYLLQYGEETASEIAKKNSMNRTFTYDRLKKLHDAGLVSSVIKDNKKYFLATEPQQLLSLLKEREEQIKDVLPELEKMRKPKEDVPKVEVYSSLKGVKTALNLMLKEQQTVFVHGSLNLFKGAFSVHFEIWNTRRVNLKIPLKILSSEKIKLELAESDQLPLEEKSITTTFTFGNSTLIVMWNDHPLAIHIDNKNIADNNRVLFNTIWNREVRIYKGKEGILQAFWEVIENTKDSVGFGLSKELADIYTVEWSNAWHEDRNTRNVKVRLVAYDDKKSRDYFTPRTKAKKDYLVRFLPRELQGPACVMISDTKIATFVYTEKQYQVIVNKNKETILAYRKYFEELWQKAKK
ncbi:helix-turn-helix domain-containing protein [Candidatus Woesearchaeota archaeon]|nr:helix-turn-helix domain-containing protein [Candidatus Woesearchaeota archaeon]